MYRIPYMYTLYVYLVWYTLYVYLYMYRTHYTIYVLYQFFRLVGLARVVEGVDEMKERCKESSRMNKHMQIQYVERRWLKKHRKTQYLSPSDALLNKLRTYFEALDRNKSGSIDEHQLQDPLITLGLCNSPQEVAAILRSIDIDGSGTIEFEEFLMAFRVANSNKGGMRSTEMATITDTLLAMEHVLDKQLSVVTGLYQLRRKLLLSAIVGPQKEKRRGLHFMQAFTRQVEYNQDLKEIHERGKTLCASLQSPSYS